METALPEHGQLLRIWWSANHLTGAKRLSKPIAWLAVPKLNITTTQKHKNTTIKENY